jgi:2-keto-4-pentenoate hydratase/2-oxohepta-3-ene-1,7-dioic acid hydratase in catechol pathway
VRLRRLATPDGPVLAVRDEPRRRWVSIDPGRLHADDRLGVAVEDAGLLELLAMGSRGTDLLRELCEAPDASPVAASAPGEPALLPFRPRLLRNFACWERHWTGAARGLVRRYLPRAYPAVRAVETLTRRTFPPLRPGELFATEPSFYLGNALTVIPDGATAPWPAYCRDLDYELELACVVCRPMVDATPDEALAAVGAFLVLNDFTARDEQWRQVRGGIFGPLGKAKTFATAIGAELVTPDEVLPSVDDLTASVSVDGEVWAETSTAGMQYGLGEVLAYASRSEMLQPGELITLGTMPGGSGVEIDRWLAPGQRVTLSIDHVGTLTNTIGERGTVAAPSTREP